MIGLAAFATLLELSLLAQLFAHFSIRPIA